jgi:hypothetical protein
MRGYEKMARYFISTGDGIEFASTEDEARKVANESLEFWRKDARQLGEWSDEVGTVYWGQVIETAKFKQLEDDGSGDYVLETKS